MATVKTTGGKIVTNGGKVSCACCGGPCNGCQTIQTLASGATSLSASISGSFDEASLDGVAVIPIASGETAFCDVSGETDTESYGDMQCKWADVYLISQKNGEGDCVVDIQLTLFDGTFYSGTCSPSSSGYGELTIPADEIFGTHTITGTNGLSATVTFS